LSPSKDLLGINQDTNTNTTASLSKISSTSKQLVKDVIAIETEKMRAESQHAATITKAHVDKMEASL
jgi:hypothetical protein